VLFASLNVFSVLFLAAAFWLSWLLDMPLSMLGPYWIAPPLAALVLGYVWFKRGIMPPFGAVPYRARYLFGHGAVLLANLMLAGGILFSLVAGHSKEDDYWSWVYLMYSIAPWAALAGAVGLVLIFTARAHANQATIQPPSR
jgi:hypothetical protein